MYSDLVHAYEEYCAKFWDGIKEEDTDDDQDGDNVALKCDSSGR